MRTLSMSRAMITVVLFFASLSNAFGAEVKSSTFAGTCKQSTITESDGIQVMPTSGAMSSQDYMAVMKKAKQTNRTLGSDGYLWKSRAIECDAVAIVLMGDYPGHTLVKFSKGDLTNPFLGFAGGRLDGEGPLFFSDTVYLEDGKALPLNAGSGQGCHFYFTDHGTFTQGWETRIMSIDCEVRLKTVDGRLVQAKATFDVTQASPQKIMRDPASIK